MEGESRKSGDSAAADDVPRPEGPRVFIVGMGQTGRDLLRRLSKSLPVVGLDLNADKLSRARKRLLGPEPSLFLKDATSRLTWRELGLFDQDTVIAMTRSDDVNLELCRVTREHFNVRRLFSLTHSAQRAEEYTALGVETIHRSQLVASYLENWIVKDRRTAFNIGLGKGEIMEVPVLPGSPVAGRKLSSFRARPWLVGAIYRKDDLIVPHGDTEIKEGDRVLLIGEPHALLGIAEFFKLGEPEFPLQYGPRIGVVTGSAAGPALSALIAESHYLARWTKTSSMALLSLPGAPEPDLEVAEQICGGTGLSCEPAYLPDEDDRLWPRRLQAHDFGCLVIGGQRLGLLRRLGLRGSLLLKILNAAAYPVLISRGAHPYQKILAPVVAGTGEKRVIELAINLARLFGSRLNAITVTEPAFAAGRDEVEEQRRVLDRVLEHSSLYRMSVRIVHREGNPIQEVVEEAKDYNLVVMGYQQRKRQLLPRLDLALEIMARAPCSVMILPYPEPEP